MKKTLVIMGTHPTGYKTFDWSRTDCDVWMFNEAATTKKENGELLYPKADAVFQLHHEAIWKSPKNRSDPKHFEWLKSGETPTVYMQKHYKNIPKSVKYPLEDTLALTKNIRLVVNGKEKEFRFFTSSPDFAFALVVNMWKKGKKYKRVEVWGIELETESEYLFQRTGFGFWAGYLAALGIDLELHTNIFTIPIYGYEGDVAITSKQFEKRIADLTHEIGDDRDTYNLEAKVFLESLSGLLNKDISESVQAEMNRLRIMGEKAGIANGRIKENIRYLEKARAMEKETGAAVFAVGEFDSSRISFNKQYLHVRTEAFNLNSEIGQICKRLLIHHEGSLERQEALNEFINKIVELMNKNMLLLHIIGAVRENQYYIDSAKLSFRNFERKL